MLQGQKTPGIADGLDDLLKGIDTQSVGEITSSDVTESQGTEVTNCDGTDSTGKAHELFCVCLFN
jgi:hypothetical protein